MPYLCIGNRDINAGYKYKNRAKYGSLYCISDKYMYA